LVYLFGSDDSFLWCLTFVQEEKKPEEKKEEPKAEKAEESKGPPPPQEIVLAVYMHCEGCARKVRRSLKGFEGAFTLFINFLFCAFDSLRFS